MKLSEIFREADVKSPPFERYIRSVQPPIDATRLAVRRKVVGEDELSVPVDPEVGGVLEIQYQGRAGGVLSIAEDPDRETWIIPSVQGARSRKSYRVSSAVEWERLLAHDALQCAQVQGALVRRIVMPPLHSVTSICEAASERIEERYARVRGALKMEWSQEEGRFIRDL